MKNIAIIGFGGMGKRHAKDLEEFSHGAIAVAAVVEPSDTRFAEGCRWLGRAPRRFGSIPELLAAMTPDGIVIATPNHLHLSCMEALAGRSIPLLLEKPIETTLEKIEKVIALAHASGAPVMVHHVMRYAPIVRKARELILGGAIGAVRGFHLVQFIGGSMFHTFRRTLAEGGGQLLEKATHDFDVLLYLTGLRPARVAALCRQLYFGGDKPATLRCRDCAEIACCPEAVRPAEGADPGDDAVRVDDLCSFAENVDAFDTENCLIEMETGEVGTYSQAFFPGTAPFSRRYEFNGTRGFLSLDFAGRTVYLATREREETLSFDYEGRIHYNGQPGVAAHFLELMERPETEVISPLEEAFLAEKIALAAYASSRAEAFTELASLGCGAAFNGSALA